MMHVVIRPLRVSSSVTGIEIQLRGMRGTIFIFRDVERDETGLLATAGSLSLAGGHVGQQREDALLLEQIKITFQVG